jgi:hypothetical protein
MEQWKDIKDYEGLYQVSNQGNVKSLKWGKERLMKPQISRRGYYQINLWRNCKSKTFIVHRLVYQAFKGGLIEGLVIDHINGIPTQNNIENLQQISYRENIIKGEHCKNTTSKYVGVSWHKPRNKWIAQIGINGKQKNLGYFKCELAAAQAYQQQLNKI